MNGVWEWSVLRPCWGAADWSCTDLPPGPWGFVTHVCGARLNTFSHSVPVIVSLSFSLSLATRASSLAMQCSGPYIPAPLNLQLPQYSANNRFPSSFCFDFLSILFPLTDSVISFILSSTLSLVIPSLKSFCPPCGFLFLLYFIDNFTIVSFITVLLSYIWCMFVEISISISIE